MSGHLYQLKTPAKVGQYVIIDGPWDKYGQVIKLQEKSYHLIRGMGNNKPEGIIYSTGND